MRLVPECGELLELAGRLGGGCLTELGRRDLRVRIEMSTRCTVCGEGEGEQTNLALVVGLRLDLALLLQTVNNVLVSPADLVRETLCDI